MVMRVEPLAAALEAIAAARGRSHRILLTRAAGRPIRQPPVGSLPTIALTLVCGRYEGVDERVSSLVDEELRIGDFVLAGGELAAAVILEATGRLVPGVLGCGTVRRRRVVLVGAARVPTMDPAGHLERPVCPGRAAFGRPRCHRALATG